MSILFDRLRKDPLAKEIEPTKSKFYEKRSEGEPYLFYNDIELDPLMGHEIKYYENGVLLSIKDHLKYFDNSKSYVFYNLEGKKVFELYNTKTVYNREIAASVPIEPTYDIDLKITECYVHVIERDFVTNNENEYFVSISNGKKILDVFEKYETKDSSLEI